MSYYGREIRGLNPRDFGAKGDGVTDDTLAFQACQAEAISSGFHAVFFDDGIYPIGSQGIAPPLSGGCYLLGDIGVDDFVFEGSGPGSVLRIHPDQTGAPSFAVLGLNAVSNPVAKRVVIRNFRIDGNAANVVIGGGQVLAGIDIVTGEDVRVESIVCHDIPATLSVGIKVGGVVDGVFVTRGIVRNCISHDHASGFGIKITNVDEFTTIENSIAYNCYHDFNIHNLGNALNVSRNVLVRNCTSVAGPNANNDVSFLIDSGVSEPGQDIQVDGCTVLGRVQIDEVDRAFFDDCIFSNVGAIGSTVILNAQVERASITNSILESTTGDPVVSLSGASGVGPKNAVSIRDSIVLADTQGIAGDRVGGEDLIIDGTVFIKTRDAVDDAYMVDIDSTSRSSAIVGFDGTAEQVDVEGDIREFLSSGDKFQITGTTLNDGFYTVSSITYVAPNTQITVNENIQDEVAVGSVLYAANDSIRIRRNVFAGKNRDIRISAVTFTNSWKSIVVLENYLGCSGFVNSAGVDFQTTGGGTFGSYPALINNILGPTKDRMVSLGDFALFLLDAYIVSSNYETNIANNPRGIARRLVTTSSPEARVGAWVGEEATDVNGGAGAVHYVKDAGDLTLFNWRSK